MTRASAATALVRLLRSLGSAALVPTVALSVYLLFSHRGGPPRAANDYTALAASIVLGMALVWRLLEGFAARILWCVALTGPMALWLGFYGWLFLCVVFRDCGPS